MAPEPEARPDPPARLGVPVQRAEDRDQDQVPVAWLNEREHLDTAERLDRLTADYELVTDLAFSQFTGPRYDFFQTELAKYGLAVIGGWLRRGLIFARCRDRGFGGLPEPPPGTFDDPDVVAELANETVAKALVHFRTDILLTNRWDYRRGATLRTFFIGQCLIRFANIYRAWHHSEMSRRPTPADHDDLDILDRRRVPSVAEMVADADLAARTLASVRNPQVREAMLLRAADLSHAEIARRLGVTEKAVERMFANERDRIRKRGIA